MKRYAVIGDYVRSKEDGDLHFISSWQLMHLYGLKEKDCFLCDSRNPKSMIGIPDNIERLCPRYDGNYKIGVKNVS